MDNNSSGAAVAEMANTTGIFHINADLEYIRENMDNVFLLTNAIFVSLMQSGFACLEAGCVRTKNTTNIIMKNIMDIFISCFAYWLIGYGVAYGEGGNPIVGMSHYAGIGLTSDMMANWFFQFVFAATAATILSGAVAERCNYITYICYSFVISGFVYPIVSHWVWTPEGWLKSFGYSDFAGAGAVHLLAGTCCLVAAILLGPRIGRFDDDAEEIQGHSVPLVGIGAMILITGFLAFNGGTLGTVAHAGDGATVAQVIANTVMAGAGGGIPVLFASKFGLIGTQRVWAFSTTVNAALAGMVSVCGGCNRMVLWTSLLSGIFAGPIFLAFRFLIIKLKIDDPVDAFPVHFGGGLWGVIATCIFTNEGLIFDRSTERFKALGYNLAGAGAITFWAAITSLIMFGILRMLGVLRVKFEDELIGLDIAMHGEPGYPHQGWTTNQAVNPKLALTKKTENQLSNNSNVIFQNFGFDDTEQNNLS